MKEELIHKASYPTDSKKGLCPKLNKKNISWVACLSDGYALTNSQLYETNLFGRIVWEMCDGEHTIEEIINEVEKTLLDYFAGDITEKLIVDIKKEIARFIDVMEKEGLIIWTKKNP